MNGYMRNGTSKNSQTENPPTHTVLQLEQRKRLCKIVSAKGDPVGDVLIELRELQDALRGAFNDDGWGSGGIMLRYPFG
jgi:hypothetical protein